MVVLAVDPSPAIRHPYTLPTVLTPSPKPPARVPSRIPDSAYELGHRICTDGWQRAVAWRLSGALNDAAWSALRKRPSGLCRLLAEAATKIEDAASAAGKAAGLVTFGILRRLGLPGLVQKIGQTIVAKAVPKIGESQTAAVAHCLRVIGIWLCVARGDPLRACRCFEAVATGHTEDWIEDELTRHLTCLRAPAAGVR